MTACRCRFHDGCTVHDDDGRRWDSYTAEEVVRLDGAGVVVEKAKAQDACYCYCGRHEDTGNELPVGTPCVWRRTSWEYDEWECKCLEAYRDRWLSHQSVDWQALGRAADRRWRVQRFLIPLRYFFRRWYYRIRYGA